MPSPVAHSMAGVAAYLLGNRWKGKQTFFFLFLVWIAAVAPDIDYFPVLWGDLTLANLNHQHFTHSFFFSVIVAIALSIIGKWMLPGYSAKSLFPIMLLAGVSHQVMDCFTHDGRYPIGIPLLWPLDIRFNSPIAVFIGVSKGSFGQIFSAQNLMVVLREILVGGVLILSTWWFNRNRSAPNPNS